jgi:hypothetical protein
VIPAEPAMPLQSRAAEVRFTIGAEGQVSGGAFTGYGAPDDEDPPTCVRISAIPPATMRAMRGRSKGPVTIVMRFEHAVEGMAMPPVPALAAKFKRVALWSGAFDIDAMGYPTHCSGAIDGIDVQMPVATCGRELRYELQDAGHKVSIRISYYTDGDPVVGAALPALGDLFE